MHDPNTRPSASPSHPVMCSPTSLDFQPTPVNYARPNHPVMYSPSSLEFQPTPVNDARPLSESLRPAMGGLMVLLIASHSNTAGNSGLINQARSAIAFHIELLTGTINTPEGDIFFPPCSFPTLTISRIMHAMSLCQAAELARTARRR